MTRFLSFSMLIAAAVLSVAMVACSADAEDGDNAGDDPTTTPTATAPSTSTPNGDEPTSSVPDGTATAPASPTAPVAPTNDDIDDIRRVEVLAPIEEINVLFLESFPVQHRLDVTSGLPGGCAAFEGIEVVRDGTTFTVTVTNTEPAPDQNVACTMIYGYHESTVDLGNDLESGTEYTVNVNDKTITFVAG